MAVKATLSTILMLGPALSCVAEDQPDAKPIELEFLKAAIGVWDAEIEVWPQRLDSPSIKFNGVETNRTFGEYWIASDFDSEFMGQTVKVHSIVGYDLDRKKLIGTVIDRGPYAASMTGDYDQESKTVTWKTEARTPAGKPMLQKTSVTQKNSEERILVLSVPGKQKDEFKKFMQIRFFKRQQKAVSNAK